jgi:hypothetical protein
MPIRNYAMTEDHDRAGTSPTIKEPSRSQDKAPTEDRHEQAVAQPPDAALPAIEEYQSTTKAKYATNHRGLQLRLAGIS